MIYIVLEPFNNRRKHLCWWCKEEIATTIVNIYQKDNEEKLKDFFIICDKCLNKLRLAICLSTK